MDDREGLMRGFKTMQLFLLFKAKGWDLETVESLGADQWQLAAAIVGSRSPSDTTKEWIYEFYRLTDAALARGYESFPDAEWLQN